MAGSGPLLSKEERKQLGVWLTIIPDLSQFTRFGEVAWSEPMLTHIMRVTNFGRYTPGLRLIMAAPTLTEKQVFTPEFEPCWRRWFHRDSNYGYGLSIRHGSAKYDGPSYNFGNGAINTSAIIYTAAHFDRTRVPYSREWASILRQYLPKGSILRPTGWSASRSDDENPTLGDWIDRGEIALPEHPLQSDIVTPRYVVVVTNVHDRIQASVHSLLPKA